MKFFLVSAVSIALAYAMGWETARRHRVGAMQSMHTNGFPCAHDNVDTTDVADRDRVDVQVQDCDGQWKTLAFGATFGGTPGLMVAMLMDASEQDAFVINELNTDQHLRLRPSIVVPNIHDQLRDANREAWQRPHGQISVFDDQFGDKMDRIFARQRQ